MVRHDRCCVGPCDNDTRYKDQYDVKSHVTTLKFHRFPKNEEKMNVWTGLVNKGRENFIPTSGSRICSNHFVDGEPSLKNPNPTLYLTLQDTRESKMVSRRSSPRKRSLVSQTAPVYDSEGQSVKVSTEAIPIPMKFEHLTREFDVRFSTGMENNAIFKAIFDHLIPRVRVMNYWYGPKETSSDETNTTSSYQRNVETIISSNAYCEGEVLPINRRGPDRKLTYEQEYLLVLMRLRLGLLVKDLGFRFQVSSARVSQIWITWIKLLSKELRHLIIWPSKGQIFATLPDAFKRLYPKVQTIIDCTEVFVETPNSLEVQALLWSEYKHHCTIKYLVAITPNGAISWVSPCYGGRTTDKYIVKDSGFLDILEPYDTLMADRGFKIKSELTMKRCYLAIPPSAAKGTQMTHDDVMTTNRIANVRIFVEKAIARIKWYRILKREMSLLELPIADDIVITCCALVNLLPPLVD